MMKLILCDDDPKFLEYMKRFLISELGFTTIILTCTDYKRLFTILETNTDCDLLFMDICLQNQNGILLSQKILKQYPQLLVVFISGYADSYYQQAFLKVRPYGFLRKPVDHQLLLQLIQKFQKEQATRSPNYYYFKTSDGLEKILFDDIYFFENNGHHVYIYTDTDVLSVRTTFFKILSILPANHFIQCHRRYIVNLKHVKKYQKDYFIMANESQDKIEISQLRISDVKKHFFEFLANNPA